MKQVIILRKDLGMNKGKMIAQGAHAAMMFLINEDTGPGIPEWCAGSMAKIVVGVDSVAELLDIKFKAEDARLRVYQVVDSGKTVPACEGQITCIAIGPNDEAEIDKITGHLKLL